MVKFAQNTIQKLNQYLNRPETTNMQKKNIHILLALNKKGPGESEDSICGWLNVSPSYIKEMLKELEVYGLLGAINYQEGVLSAGLKIYIRNLIKTRPSIGNKWTAPLIIRDLYKTEKADYISESIVLSVLKEYPETKEHMERKW